MNFGNCRVTAYDETPHAATRASLWSGVGRRTISPATAICLASDGDFVKEALSFLLPKSLFAPFGDDDDLDSQIVTPTAAVTTQVAVAATCQAQVLVGLINRYLAVLFFTWLALAAKVAL